MAISIDCSGIAQLAFAALDICGDTIYTNRRQEQLTQHKMSSHELQPRMFRIHMCFFSHICVHCYTIVLHLMTHKAFTSASVPLLASRCLFPGFFPLRFFPWAALYLCRFCP